MASRTYQVTLATTATLIAWYSADRQSIIIRNDSGQTIYHSPDGEVSTTRGAAMPSGSSRGWYKQKGDSVNRPWYGVSSSGTATVTVEEHLGDPT